MSAAVQVEQDWTPRQADFDAFAALSGDDNPIHVDPVFSEKSRFGRPVAHGMLLYARVWALICENWPGRYHKIQELMFPAPSFADETLRITIAADEVDADTLAITIMRKADATVTLSGTCRLSRENVDAIG